jgi:hypothetical protein
MSLKERMYRFRSFWIFPILALLLLTITSRTEAQHSQNNGIGLFVIGLLGWTLLEYGLHRFVFHVQVPLRNPAAVVMTGIWAGFLYYEAVHYRVHFSLSPTGIIAKQRRTHFYHHFSNNKRCFGVTSPLWDYVFGTNLK